MSSVESVSGHSFEIVDGDECRFIYGFQEDGYDEHNFRGALEADVDVVIDLDGRDGWYRPNLGDEELAAAIPGIHQYADQQGLDTYSITFSEEPAPEWRGIVKEVWEEIEAEEELEHEKAVASDGSGKKFDMITYNAATAPIGMDHSADDLR